MRKKKNKGAFWRQLNAMAHNSVRMCLSQNAVTAHTMIQLKNTKEQKEGKSKEGMDLCVARETESNSRLQQNLISHG
jgi:hypothetical protein